MLQKVVEKYEQLHPAAKVAILGAGAYLAYTLLSDDDIEEGQSHTRVDPNKKRLSYPIGSYDIWADELFTAIWGDGFIADWTEDDDLIGDILSRMNNIDDVYQLIKSYGRRTVGLVVEDGGNLPEEIAEYLDDDVKDDVNEDYRTKNIPFQW